MPSPHLGTPTPTPTPSPQASLADAGLALRTRRMDPICSSPLTSHLSKSPSSPFPPPALRSPLALLPASALLHPTESLFSLPHSFGTRANNKLVVRTFVHFYFTQPASARIATLTHSHTLLHPILSPNPKSQIPINFFQVSKPP